MVTRGFILRDRDGSIKLIGLIRAAIPGQHHGIINAIRGNGTPGRFLDTTACGWEQRNTVPGGVWPKRAGGRMAGSLLGRLV